MTHIASLLTSKVGWLSILTGLSVILSTIIPMIPQPWGGLVSAILAILTYYHIGKTVNVAYTAGVRGL